MLFLLLSAGERRKLDIEYFSKLLEMILEVQKNRKKHKSLAKKNGSQKKRRKRRRARQKLSDVEEEEEDGIPDLEEDKEEENADPCSESQVPVTPPKTQRKRRRGQDATTDAPDEGKRGLRDDGEGGRAATTRSPSGCLCLRFTTSLCLIRKGLHA